ncbi:hypothetical protein ACFQ3S_01815 [Mucilaginibacter terrae]|uniref:hypothetical protein n=1 Tax=Mucilaginibacter terrae TaxID=1955052 RepID=UPI003625ACAE
MKKFVLSIILAAGGLVAQSANAQVGVSVGMRIGPLVINIHKPIAPAVVYDDFYYLPDVEAYYSVPEQSYYYMNGNRWVNAAYLPGRYRNFDWRNARRYQVRTQRPYANHNYYRNKFGGNPGGNWNDNNQYANREPERRDDRRSNDRFPSPPYDSNNGGGRGGYNQPDRRNDDNRYERGDNRGGQNDNDRGNANSQPNRSNNGQGNYGRPYNGQPSNQNGGNRGNNNQNNGKEQRYTQNNGGDRRIPFGSVEKVSF